MPAVAYHIGTGFSAAYLGVDIFSVFVLKQIDAVKFIPRVIRAHIAEKGGGYIHQRADFVRFLGSVIRMMDHEWNMAGGVHHGSFADGIVVTHHIAVVTGKENQGILIHSLCFQRVNDTAQLIIDERDTGVIVVLCSENILPAHLEPVA